MYVSSYAFVFVFFFFKQKTAYEMRISDWSSDVCSSDLKELHASHVPGRAPLLGGLGLCLLAARATGKVILDGVYNDIKDPEGFAAECRAGQQMGFDGKTLIHPSQVEPCNEAFAPSAEEVEKAGRIIAAFEEAEADGRGVVTVDGRMVENLHVRSEERRVGKGCVSTCRSRGR